MNSRALFTIFKEVSLIYLKVCCWFRPTWGSNEFDKCWLGNGLSGPFPTLNDRLTVHGLSWLKSTLHTSPFALFTSSWLYLQLTQKHSFLLSGESSPASREGRAFILFYDLVVTWRSLEKKFVQRGRQPPRSLYFRLCFHSCGESHFIYPRLRSFCHFTRDTRVTEKSIVAQLWVGLLHF